MAEGMSFLFDLLRLFAITDAVIFPQREDRRVSVADAIEASY